jgi:multidrug efflux system membrane fusion protein
MIVKNTLLPLMAALAMASCNSNEPIEQPPQGVRAKTIEAAHGASSGLRFSAVVMPDAQVPLAFRIPGYVVSIKEVRGEDGRMREIAEGDRVRRGDALARIRSAEYEDQVRQAVSQAEAAEATAVKAQLDWERANLLYAAQSITKPDYDAARAQYDASQAVVRAAKARTSEAETALRDTTLLAPFDGEIVKKAVELGAYVGPAIPTFAVAKTDLVKIVVGVPDTTVRSLQVGQRVAVSVDAFPGETFHARISRISSAADPKTRNFEVEVAIPNPNHLLKVGMIGSLQFLDGVVEQHPSGLLVPLEAIVQGPEGGYGVFLVSESSEGSVAKLTPVEVGAVEGNEIRVVDGLAPGATVVTAGSTLLKDGQRVEVLK